MAGQGGAKLGKARMFLRCSMRRSRNMEMTHQEIADKLGISKGRVWQIEKEALKKLRKKLFILDITEFSSFGMENLTNRSAENSCGLKDSTEREIINMLTEPDPPTRQDSP
jgi:transcriptional regulator with XRE-family HTH domain